MSKLVDYEMCIACGNCCKSFRAWYDDSEGFATRLALAGGELLQANGSVILVQTNVPCKQYDENTGKCLVYGLDERPKLCSDFPDSLFDVDVDNQLILDGEHAARIIAAYEGYCLGIAKLKALQDLP